ncbi:hypothetical protein [Paraburkholderia azotifigens]
MQCDDCIAYRLHDAMKCGASRHEILEAVAS